METTMKGLCALQRLRQEIQDDAGLEFPQALHIEMLVIYDVCKRLDFNIFQCKEVLGVIGWQYINDYLETRITVCEGMQL
ncbi:hypothetical protein BH10CHL1_BH10CHL1_45170 [soil metagenome]